MKTLTQLFIVAAMVITPSLCVAEVRLRGPAIIAPDVPALVRVEKREGKRWRLVDPADYRVDELDGLRVVPDPAGEPMNPLTIVGKTAGEATLGVYVGGQAGSLSLTVGQQLPVGEVRVSVRPRKATHSFDGFGGGVLFYDNQWELSEGDEIWDWCFQDVQTDFLHLLIRPAYEKENDNADWKTLEPGGFDFKKSTRAINVATKALEKRPQMKIYLSLYSPPAWMKQGDTTRGDKGLKPDPQMRLELAEYVYAYLKRLKYANITVDYLALFNEPGFPHEQDGMHIKDFGELTAIFADTSAALQELIKQDDTLEMPKLIFADSLGAGTITRSKTNTPKLLQQTSLLRRRVDVWGVHDYWNQKGYWPKRYGELRNFPAVGNKPIWMTEWAQRDKRGDLASANQYAANMLNAIRLGAQAWMVFEWCHPSGNQSGLISCNWGAKPPLKEYWRSKAYYVFRQIANTLPEDAQVAPSEAQGRGEIRVSTGGKNAQVEHMAFVNDDRVVAHVSNSSQSPVRLQLTWPCKKEPQKWGALITGPTANNEKYNGLEMKFRRRNIEFTGELPANSLVTVVAE